jgi:N utilization substance protein A
LPNDTYRANGTIKVYLKKVCEGSQRGPQLLVSRADAGLVVYLFANEVPEIEDDIVRIVAVAREANPPSRHVGPRTKIAVDTVERDVDPVGACIGARGSRIQVVVNELRGEKIDVIRWSPDPATYIANALSPARVVEVRLMNPEERQAHVLVGDDQLSLAIGKEGQNVRLAARLTGWKIDIRDVAKYDRDEEDAKMASYLAEREAALALAAAEAADDFADEEPETDDFADEDAEFSHGEIDPSAAANDATDDEFDGDDLEDDQEQAPLDSAADADEDDQEEDDQDSDDSDPDDLAENDSADEDFDGDDPDREALDQEAN